MARRKINQEIANTVSKLASDDASAEKLKSLKDQRGRVGYALFASLAGEDVMSKLTSLPIEFINTNTQFDVGIADEKGQSTSRIDGKKYKNWKRIQFDASRPCLGYYYSGAECWSIDENHPLLVEYERLDAEIGVVADATEEARVKIKSLLFSAKTVEKAIEIWPEGKKYLERYLAESTSNLPAVQVDDVNAALSALAA